MRTEFSIIPPPAGERQKQVNATDETVERTRRDMGVIRQQFDKHVDDYERHVQMIWIVVAVLILSGIGFSWYGYAHISGLLSQIPGLQQMASAMDARVTSIEGKVSEWANDRTSLTDRMAKLETTVGSNLKTARNQAQSFANQMAQKIRAEVNENLQRLQARLGNVESAQRETQDQVAQLHTEIAGLHQQMTTIQKQHADELSELRQATQADVDRIDNQVATMNNQVGTHTEKLAALSNQVDRERVAFEVSTDKTAQVAPGIYVTVKHADVAHQKVDGWMQLAEDGRIVWISGLAAQEALTFLTRSDNRAHELVFTGVQQGRATGYLLLPMK